MPTTAASYDGTWWRLQNVCAHSTEGTRRRVHSPSCATRSSVTSLTAVRGSTNPSTPRRADTNWCRCSWSTLSEARTVVDPVRDASRAGAFIRGREPRRNRSIHAMGTSVPSRASGWCGHTGNRCKDGRVSDFDVLILGAGSGGYSCALRAAQLGLRVGLVEKSQLGGTCLHIGCIPTKALLHAAEIADTTRESEQFGVKATLDGIDMAGVNAYKDGVVQRLFKGLTGLIKGRGITVLEGEGRLTGPRTVTVTSPTATTDQPLTYVGRHVVLASGSYSRSLPGLDIDGTHVISSEHALRLDRVPESAIVLGGGVIGCEFASVWASFGTQVTVVEALPRLVPAEDEASSKALERAFRKRKIGFRTGTPFQSVKTSDDGVLVTLEGGDTIEAELMLVAVGRG